MIYSIKKCRTKTILREHLHDILPVNEERRRLLPTLLISVGQTRIYPFQMTIKYDGNFSLPVDYSSSKLSEVHDLSLDLEASA